MYLVIVDSNHLALSRNEHLALTSGNPQTLKHGVLAESNACSRPANLPVQNIIPQSLFSPSKAGTLWAFGKSRIVEDHLPEVFHRPLIGEYGLTDRRSQRIEGAGDNSGK
jgi:hypothetical protein